MTFLDLDLQLSKRNISQYKNNWFPSFSQALLKVSKSMDVGLPSGHTCQRQLYPQWNLDADQKRKPSSRKAHGSLSPNGKSNQCSDLTLQDWFVPWYHVRVFWPTKKHESLMWRLFSHFSLFWRRMSQQFHMPWAAEAVRPGRVAASSWSLTSTSNLLRACSHLVSCKPTRLGHNLSRWIKMDQGKW